MDEEKIFTQHGLNRKTLSIMLNTNEKYMHDMIKEFYGMSCSEYINSLRIDHACRLLDDVNITGRSKKLLTIPAFLHRKRSTGSFARTTIVALPNTKKKENCK